MIPRKTSVCRTRTGAASLVAALLILAGCGGEDAMTRQSREKLQGYMSANPDQAGYALSLVVDNPSPHALSLVVEAIGSTNAKTAREAVQAIQANPPEAAREALAATFAEKKGLLKLEAAIALARMGDAEALGWLRGECLEGAGQSLTVSAAKLLAEHGGTEDLKRIIASRLGNADASIRNEAYRMLAGIHEEWATQMLMKGLENEVGQEREQAILSLGDTGDPAAAKAVEKYVNSQGLALTAIEVLGRLDNPDSIPVLERKMKQTDPSVQVFAAAAIWRLGDEAKALEVLQPAATGEDAAVRLAVAEQLRGIRSPTAKEMLTGLASDEDGSVQVAAIRALAAMQDPSLNPVFLGAAADKSYQVSTSALDALAKVGGADSLETIEPLLENPNPYVVMSAANAILAIKQRTAGPA